jgi:hypothetical protein
VNEPDATVGERVLLAFESYEAANVATQIDVACGPCPGLHLDPPNH